MRGLYHTRSMAISYGAHLRALAEGGGERQAVRLRIGGDRGEQRARGGVGGAAGAGGDHELGRGELAQHVAEQRLGQREQHRCARTCAARQPGISMLYRTSI